MHQILSSFLNIFSAVFKMSANSQDLVKNIKTEAIESESEPEAAPAPLSSNEATSQVKSDPERQWLQCLNNDDIKKEPLGRTCEKCGRVTMVKNHKCETWCKICNKKLSSKRSLIDHLQNVHRAEPDCKFFECDFCGVRFLQKHNLIRHLKQKHQSGKIDEFQCDYDGKIFKSKDRIFRHMKQCHRAVSKCEICESLVKNMRKHLKFMHPVETNKVACKICDKTFKFKILLTRHLKVHNKKFENYKRHMKTHDKNRKKSHQCKQCEYAAHTRTHLKRHLQVHDKNRVRNLKCEKCEKSFYDKLHLNQHMNIHNKNRKMFPCQHCDYKAGNKYYLKKHIATQHDKKKM
jgi:KRAB domain-containing zinc finger protein